MTLERVQATEMNLAESGGLPRSAQRFFQKHPEIWVAIVLWLASNAFVTVFSNFARWETGAPYYSVSDLCRWDCGWYGSVLESGYDKTPYRGVQRNEANWGFHPLFPFTAYPLHYWLKLSLATSLVLASKAALLFAIYGFLLMVGAEAETLTDRFAAGSLVAFHPYVIYAHAGYAEPLYFAMAAFAFVFASRKQWIASGIAGAFFSATRLVGFIFAPSYALMSLRESGWRKYDLTKFIGLLLCPLGTAVYMLYLYRHTGDALAQLHVHVAWVRQPLDPWFTFKQCITGHQWLRVWGVMIIGGFLASARLFKLRKPELGVFLGLAILISISGGAYAIARYIWWQPPLIYAIYCALKRYPAWWTVYTAFASGMAAFMVVGWFSGHNFVV